MYILGETRPLRLVALGLAVTQLGVRESGRNRGREVDAYLRSVGIDPETGSFPWCAAFVHWCFDAAAATLDRQCPVPKTAGVLKALAMAKAGKVTRTELATVRPRVLGPDDLPDRGHVYYYPTGGGRGHCGIVESVTVDDAGIHVETCEGNTDASGTREGDGVYRRRRLVLPTWRFVEYG